MHCNKCSRLSSVYNISCMYVRIRPNIQHVMFICSHKRDIQSLVSATALKEIPNTCVHYKISLCLPKHLFFFALAFETGFGIWTWKYISAYSVIYTNEHGRMRVLCLVWKCGVCDSYCWNTYKEIDVKSVGHKPAHTWVKNGSYKSSWHIMTKDGARQYAYAWALHLYYIIWRKMGGWQRRCC